MPKRKNKNVARNVPRKTMVKGQPHKLAYINPTEESLLQTYRGGGPTVAGPDGVPAYYARDADMGVGGSSSSNSSKGGGGKNSRGGGSSSSSSSSSSRGSSSSSSSRGSSSSSSGTSGGNGDGDNNRNGGYFGGYTSGIDMIDGGGPGRSGDTFGGALGGFSNSLGATPYGSGREPTGFAGGVSAVTGIGGPANPMAAALAGGLMGGPAGALTGYGRAKLQNAVEARGGLSEFLGVPEGGFLSSLSGMGASAAPLSNATGVSQREGDGDENRRLLLLQQQNAAAGTGATDAPGVPEDLLTGEEVSRRNARRSLVPTYEEGGMVGPDGTPIRPSTSTPELPAVMQGLLNLPSYAEGGMVGPNGVPQRPMTSPMAVDVMQRGGAPVVGLAQPGETGRPLNFAAIDAEAQRFTQQNPQQVEQIKAEVQSAMAAGELDATALNMFVQVATVALQNPSMWPQLRQTLINQDMVDPEDIGEEFDQGFLVTLYIVGKTLGAQAQGQMPMSAGQAPQMSMSEGGPLPAKSENPDGSIPINAHEGEYVVPADVTRKLGTDHFDKLIAKARNMDAKGEEK